MGADGLYSTPLGASPDRAGDTPPGGGAPAAAAASASVGEYCGEVGLYCGLHIVTEGGRPDVRQIVEEALLAGALTHSSALLPCA